MLSLRFLPSLRPAKRPLTRPRLQTSPTRKMSSTSSNKPLLYHRPHTASSIPFIVIEELKLKDKVDVLVCKNGEHKAGDLATINPHGFAPLFKLENGGHIIESGAIALYIIEKYAESTPILLGSAEHRAELLQWTFYGPSTFYPDIVPIWKDPSVKGSPEKLEQLKKQIYEKNFALISNALSNGNQYLLGSEFSLADIVVGYSLAGLHFLGWIDAEKAPLISAYMARLMERPSFKLAYSV